jgi:hypothetical protein
MLPVPRRIGDGRWRSAQLSVKENGSEIASAPRQIDGRAGERHADGVIPTRFSVDWRLEHQLQTALQGGSI